MPMRFATPFAVIACVACALALAQPAHAQSKENLRKLSDAYKLMQGDKTAEAIKQLDAVIEATPEDTDAASKAMLLRAQAYAKSGRHAQALADFNAALWLQGLSSSQRKEATDGRKAALAKLGVSEDAPSADASPAQPPASAATPAPAPPAATARPARTPAQPAASAWQTDVEAPREQPRDSGGIGGFFSSLFGGSSTAGEERTASIAEERDAAPVSGWTATTAEIGQTSRPAAATTEGGQFRVQIASVSTREGAEAESRRLTRMLGDAIAGESTNIVQTDTAAGNTYYRIIVGPKPSRDQAEEMCQMFKSRGVDCLVLSSR